MDQQRPLLEWLLQFPHKEWQWRGASSYLSSLWLSAAINLAFVYLSDRIGQFTREESQRLPLRCDRKKNKG